MPEFKSDGVRISYRLAGPDDGPPVLLVHGFASSYSLNWVGSRWEEALTAGGRLVVGPDLRGHGASDKPHDPQAYGRRMYMDLIRLLDHLDIARADYVGYSMGARLGLQLVLNHPDRIHRAVFGGLGQIGAWSKAQTVARRLRGDSAEEDPVAVFFHRFATMRGQDNDLEALAACITGPGIEVAEEHLAGIRTPILLAVGDRDPLAKGARHLADAIPTAEFLDLPGRDHMTAVVDRQFRERAVSFLDS